MRFRLLASVLIAGVALAAYAGGLDGPFVFDDQAAVVDNPSIRSVWPVPAALAAPSQSPMAGRPVVNLTLAANYAAGGLDVRGYHMVNIAVHVLCAIVLMAVVGRTLRRGGFGPQVTAAAGGLSLAVALIWCLHPLQTECVNYITQRTESIMALFYLLTLYCAVRADDADGGPVARSWALAAVAACGLGMASKEVMVTAPVAVVLFDLAYARTPWRQTLHRRRWLYAGLASTWLILAALVMAGPRAESVGFGLGVGPLEYALSQAVAVAHYLKLIVLPAGLSIDYGPFRGTDPATAALCGVVVGTLVIASVVLLVRRPRIGFPAAWFFLLLAPTSTIVPITSEVAAERRVYLAMAGIAALVVVAAHVLTTRRGGLAGRLRVPAAATAAVVLLAVSFSRTIDYQTPLMLWHSAVEAVPDNPRAHTNLGNALRNEGRPDLAAEHYREALRLDPDSALAHANLGAQLAEGGDLRGAIHHLTRALEIRPDLEQPQANLVRALTEAGVERETVPMR